MKVYELFDEIDRGRELMDDFFRTTSFSMDNRYFFILREDDVWLSVLDKVLTNIDESNVRYVYLFGTKEGLQQIHASNDNIIICEMDDVNVKAMAKYIQMFGMSFWRRWNVPFVFFFDMSRNGTSWEEMISINDILPEEYIKKALMYM